MKHSWQIFALWGFWVLILWLMAHCLDPKPEPAPQGKLMILVPGRCNCPWFKFRKSGLPSETLNSSLYQHRVGERGLFVECYEKMMEHLTGATESMTPDSVLWWLGMNSASGLGKMWEKVFKVIPRPSVSHFHLYCGTCALAGNSKSLRASGLGNNVNQWTPAFGFWKVVQFPSGMEDSKDQDACLGFGSENQRKRGNDWEAVNQTNDYKKILSTQSMEAEMEVSYSALGKLTVHT